MLVKTGCEAITPWCAPWLKCDKRDSPNMKLWVTCCWLVCASLHTHLLLRWRTAHTHTFVSTGRDVPGIGHTRHKWSTVPEEYVTVGSFIHVVRAPSQRVSFFKKKRLQLPCCLSASVSIPRLGYTLFLNSLSRITLRIIPNSHQQRPWCECIS